MQRPKQFEKSAESEVWNAIDAFEQILQAMPDDRTALETLQEAYDHIGDKTKALEYLVRLAGLVTEEEDTESAGWVYHSLTEKQVDTAAVKGALAGLENMMESHGLPSPAVTPKAQRRDSGNVSVDVSAELSLAWSLVQAGQLSQDEYSQVAEDLSENSTKNIPVPVTVLHALNDRTSKALGGVLNHLARESGMPFVNLSLYEIDPAKFSLMPSAMREHKGALVFERMGEEPLVAILNPFNDDLKREVEKTLGARCHFFLTESHEYDAYLDRAKQGAPSSRAMAMA